MNKSCRDFPYQFLLPNTGNHWEEGKWCKEHFGERWNAIDNREGVWCCFWAGRKSPKCYEWLFKNKEDAMMFMLRWS